MKLFAFTMTHWDNHEQAWAQAETLNRWLVEATRYFRPWHVFVACGTWSDPLHSPLPNHVPTINGGIKRDQPYDPIWWNYAGTAIGAGLAYALTRCDWDALILHDTDVLVGAVDFDALLREFLERPETFLSAQWCGCWPCGGSFIAWKPEAAVKWLNQRRRANYIQRKPGAPAPMCLEEEMASIFKDDWWCPWKEFPTMRQDYGAPNAVTDNAAVLKWPFVRRPDPAIVEEYTRTQTSQARPVSP